MVDHSLYPVTRLLAGYYKVDAPHAFANVRRNRISRKWEADIRNNDGDLIRYAGIWNTMCEAAEEAQHILQKMA